MYIQDKKIIISRKERKKNYIKSVAKSTASAPTGWVFSGWRVRRSIVVKEVRGDECQTIEGPVLPWAASCCFRSATTCYNAVT